MPDCQSVCLPSGLSGFNICLYVCLAVCRSAQTACQKIPLSLSANGRTISCEPLTMLHKSNHPAKLDVCLCSYTQMCIQEYKQPPMYTNKSSSAKLQSTALHVLLLILKLQKPVVCCLSHKTQNLFAQTHSYKALQTHLHTQNPLHQPAKLIKHPLSNWHVVIVSSSYNKRNLFFFTPNYFFMFM